MFRRARPSMKALAAACALAASLGAKAETGSATSIFYGKLYPEWRIDRFGPPSNAGTEAGHLGTLRNDRTVLSKDASPKAVTSAWASPQPA